MKEPPTLQQYMQDYLKREGLHEMVSENSRPATIIVVIWFALLWALEAYFVLRHKGPDGILAAFLILPLAFIVIFLILAIGVAVRQVRSGKRLDGANSNVIGGAIIFGLPIMLALSIGLYLLSWTTALWYMVLSLVAIVLVALLQYQAYRIRLLIEAARSVLRIMGRSVSLLFVLMPVLLVIVLLSVFSQELWEALGNLSVPRVVGIMFLLALPALLLTLMSLRKEAACIVGEFPSIDRILEIAKSDPFFESKTSSGLVSDEEWAKARDELAWRDTDRLAQSLLPLVQRRVERWLALLMALTSIILLMAFFIYFYALFNILLTPNLVAKWVGIQIESIRLSLNFLGNANLIVSSAAIPVAKVSLVLATFVAMMSSVYAITDDSFKERFTAWLREKCDSWLAIGSLYLSVVSANYQIWEYVVQDKRRGIANVSVIVPRGLSEKEVESACDHMMSRLHEYRNLIIVTAFEQNVDRPVYKFGVPGNRWQLLHNKNTGVRAFEPMPLIVDNDLQYQHTLGVDCVRQGKKVPDGWFGNKPGAIDLARSIWEIDIGHALALHPYVLEDYTSLSVEVHLTKRMTRSEQYRQYIRRLLDMARERFPGAGAIWISLYFRDTVDVLARLNWARPFPFVSYHDEVTRKSKSEDAKVWGLV